MLSSACLNGKLQKWFSLHPATDKRLQTKGLDLAIIGYKNVVEFSEQRIRVASIFILKFKYAKTPV